MVTILTWGNFKFQSEVIRNNRLVKPYQFNNLNIIGNCVINAPVTINPSRQRITLSILMHKILSTIFFQQRKQFMFMWQDIMVADQEPRCMSSVGSEPLKDFLVQIWATITSRVHSNNDNTLNKDSKSLAIIETEKLQRPNSQAAPNKDTHSSVTPLGILMTLLAEKRIAPRKHTMRNGGNISLAD